jgi:RND superfamily putative drug exporter
MTKLNDLAGRKRNWVLGVWLLLVIVAVPLSARQTENLTSGGFVAPESPSAEVDRALADFPRASRSQQGILLELEAGKPPIALRRAVRRVAREADAIPGVVSARPAVGAAKRRLQRSNLRLVTVAVGGGQDNRVDTLTKVIGELDIGESQDGVRSYLLGLDSAWAALHGVQQEQLAAAERVGFPLTLIILLVTFGAFAAALLPIALGIVSVTLTGAVVYVLSQHLAMSLFVTNAAAMLGIGVAIDYSFFILARYRQEAAAGASLSRARLTALRTSGAAVVFSGLTVMIALAGVFLSDSTALRSMALGAIVVVAFSLLGAVALLPALIDLLGERLTRRGLPGRLIDRLLARLSRLRRRPPRGDFWTRWTDRVMARPVAFVVAGSAVMLALAAPAFSMVIDEGAVNSIPKDNQAREGARIAAKVVGPGAFGPVEELISFRSGSARAPRNRAALRRHVVALKALPEVDAVAVPEFTRLQPNRVLLTIIPRGGPESAATKSLVDQLRSEQGAIAVDTVAVGGPTALLDDFVALVKDSMWRITLFIVICSYFLLMLALRSIILPFKAIFMTLLSVAAAYGALVMVFQWGWLDGLLGYESPGYVDALAPPLLLAVTFGLSMDYEIFMLARIREAANEMDDRAAVAHGLRQSAGTISSAALIMISVFLAFAAVGATSIKQIGFGMAVAIAIDVTIVRLILVPATMRLLGRWNWWYPARLRRLIPGYSFE